MSTYRCHVTKIEATSDVFNDQPTLMLRMENDEGGLDRISIFSPRGLTSSQVSRIAEAINQIASEDPADEARRRAREIAGKCRVLRETLKFGGNK
jgi:hypothetical protein